MRVVAVSRDARHHFSKSNQLWIKLLAGLGVEGDAHSGRTVKHRSRVARDASQPNLRQVHLLHSELLSELQAKGFTIGAGQIGENILTEGEDTLIAEGASGEVIDGRVAFQTDSEDEFTATITKELLFPPIPFTSFFRRRPRQSAPS